VIKRALILTALLALAASGCVGQVRAVPLYPNHGQRLGHDKLAMLQGPIGTVDGQDVEAMGASFELLPGCHLVTLRSKIGEGNERGAWTADLHPMLFAFKMKPGYLYAFEYRAEFGSAGHGQLFMTARELDASGATVSLLLPSRDGRDIDECRSWGQAYYSPASQTNPPPR
jgi:hypothetical protein